MISIDGITMKKMGENSPVRVWLKYKELADKLDTSGIYAIKLCEEIVYVGQSNSLFTRLLEHCNNLFQGKAANEISQKYDMLRDFYKDLSWCVLAYEDLEDLNDAEDYYIEKYNPIFNIKTPSGNKYFWGEKEDIEDFCCGLITMDDLKAKVKDYKKTNKELKILQIEDALNDTVIIPEYISEKIKNHTLHGNAVNDILKALEFQSSECRRVNHQCILKIYIENNQLHAISCDTNGNITGKYIGRKRRIWDKP